MTDTPELTSAQIESFNRDGSLIVDFGLDPTLLDTIIASVAPYYHPECKKSGTSTRRVLDAWRYEPAARTLALHKPIHRALEQLYGRKPLPFQTLNFPRGTEQSCHCDAIHFNSVPSGFVAGVWVALEDIDENNGPLLYYPGSHKLPKYTVEDIGLKPGFESYPQYEAFITSFINRQGVEPMLATMKKGQAMIWDANLVHGGHQQLDPTRSRHSQVTHFFFEGCQYLTPLLGTRDAPVYRDPDWIVEPSLGNRLRKLKKRAKTRLARLNGSRSQIPG